MSEVATGGPMPTRGRVLVGECVRLLPYAGLVLLCFTLVAFRYERTGYWAFRFLVWNLFLAGIPLAITTGLRSMGPMGRRGWVVGPMLLLWLLFLPNAPYILTDLIHLRQRPPAPLWYDLGLLLTFAGTGLALGYRSLFDVERLMAGYVGKGRAVAMSVAVLFLCGLGIYLGRFHRLNSWEAISDPTVVLRAVVEPLTDPLSNRYTWGVTLMFGTVLTLWYAALRVVKGGEVERWG